MPQPSVTSPIGFPFVELQSVDSTNNYALQQVHAGLAQHGMAVFAHEQLAGKGRRGRVWVAEKGANIILSIVIKPPPLPLSEQFRLSACTALAIHEFFMIHAGTDTRIKWPNDLYWQDRKAGGVLIESVVGGVIGNWQWAVVGVGININQTSFPSELKNPVSLRQITGKSFDTVELAKELCGLMEKYFQQLVTGGFDTIYTQYLDVLYKRNERVKLKKGSRVFEAEIKTVLPTGKLIVQHSIEEEFDFGEVELVV